MSSKSSSTKSAILEATEKLLKENSPTRMADVAKECGLSRQGLYLHFESRTQLLVELTRHIDEKFDLAQRFVTVHETVDPIEKLDKFITFWANYVPSIYPVGKALLAEERKDDAAKAALADRMNSLQDFCIEITKELHNEQLLNEVWKPKQAGQYLWNLLSLTSWERLTQELKWSKKLHISHTIRTAHLVLLTDSAARNS